MSTKKQRLEIQNMLADYLQSIGAVESPPESFALGLYDFQLETIAGPLHLKVWTNETFTWMPTRFENPELARNCLSQWDRSLNPYSGKWNFHFVNDANKETVLDFVKSYIEPLLLSTTEEKNHV